MGCSFAWMLAQAIDEGVNEVGFFGVALQGHEYYYQRPSVERLIGRAEGEGVKIHIDETSDLLKANYIYAYEENFDLIYALHGDLARDLCMEIFIAIQQKVDSL